MREAARELQVTTLTAGADKRPIANLTAWELVNLTPAAALDLKDRLVRAWADQNPGRVRRTPPPRWPRRSGSTTSCRSATTFFSRLTGVDALRPAILCAPQTMRCSWVKGPRGWAWGPARAIPLDASYRQSIPRLREQLEKALAARHSR